jgi:hypothetical protein
MGYYIVSGDRRTVVEFRDDHKILGVVDFGDIDGVSRVIMRSDVILEGVFESGFHECLAIQKVV